MLTMECYPEGGFRQVVWFQAMLVIPPGAVDSHGVMLNFGIGGEGFKI
jgi:hypothetical protein